MGTRADEGHQVLAAQFGGCDELLLLGLQDLPFEPEKLVFGSNVVDGRVEALLVVADDEVSGEGDGLLAVAGGFE